MKKFLCILIMVFPLLCSLDFDMMPPPQNASFSPFVMTVGIEKPLENFKATSPFGYRFHPISGELDFHYGVDLKSEKKAPIFAVQNGVVLVSGNHKSYGKYIIIDHFNGFSTLYAHCSKLLKKEGERVEKGEKIAIIGKTGEATGEHLHFEIRFNGVRYDASYILDDIL